MGFLALLYGTVVYAIFFLAFLYLAAFIGGDMVAGLFGIEIPYTLDAGGPVTDTTTAAVVNFALLALFGVQHTIMARPGFKKSWTKIVPWSVERSTYVLLTTIILILIYFNWRPMPGVIWNVENSLGAGLLTAGFYLGFGLVLLSTFLINHFELFGLSQVWHRFRNLPWPKPKFRTPFLYKYVRHPLYLGWIMSFWLTPRMTVGHLFFAVVWTGYIFIAIVYEERDLTALFGEKYAEYKGRVPMVFPLSMGRKKAG